MPHRGVEIAEIEKAIVDEHRQVERAPRGDFDDVEVSAVRAGGTGRRATPVGGRANAANHGGVRDRDQVAPVDKTVADRANVAAVRAVVSQPFDKLSWVVGFRRALTGRRLDLENGNGQAIPGLGPLDGDRPGQRVAIRHLRPVSTVVVRLDLPRQRVFRLDNNRLARGNPDPRSMRAVEFVVQRTNGKMFHGKPGCLWE